MKRLLLLVVALCISTVAMAQKDEFKFSLSGAFKSASTTSANHNNPFTTQDVELTYGFHFNNKWALIVPMTGSTAMYPNTHTYSDLFLLGIGGEYKIIDNGSWDWSLVGNVQSSIGKNDWGGAIVYDFGLMEEYDNIQTAIGFKYYDAHKSYIKDRFCIYISFGFRLKM